MKKTIDFTNLRVPMLILSLLVIIAGGAYTIFVQGGFNLGIDFAAGSKIQVQIDGDNINAEVVRQALSSVEDSSVQEVSNSDNMFYVNVKENVGADNVAEDARSVVEAALAESFGAESVTIHGDSFFSSVLAENLTVDTIWMVIGTMILILIYITFRFRVQYGLSAIVTLMHDVAIMLAVIGTFQIEFTAATVAAILTIIGYSLNDTIVVFDRIRENEALVQDRDFNGIINLSITQSLSRTIITSLTTLLAIGAVYVLASGQIKDFALNMIIGIAVGTFSSIFIASPLLLMLSGNKKASAPKKAVEVSDDSEVVVEEAEGPRTTAADLDFKGSRKKKKK